MQSAIDGRNQRAGKAKYRLGTCPWRDVGFEALSISGCVLRLDETNLSEDSTIWLKFEGFNIMPANVEWAARGLTSVEFHSPLHVGVVDHILRSCGWAD